MTSAIRRIGSERKASLPHRGCEREDHAGKPALVPSERGFVLESPDAPRGPCAGLTASVGQASPAWPCWRCWPG
jgi:hypothetical protein